MKKRAFSYFILIVFTLFSLFLNSNHISFIDTEFTTPKFRTSNYWDLPFRVLIDDIDPNYNWSKTANENDWCFGSGTFSDPYVIENVTINGGRTGYCILIQNSNVFFEIRNCTFYDSSNLAGAGGCIQLNSVSNGNIINCTIYNSDYGRIGIGLSNNCYNNTIIENKIRNCKRMGIFFKTNCDENFILNNTLINNDYGIDIWIDCDNNIILNNTIKSNLNSRSSLKIRDHSDDNYVAHNNFILNTIAIRDNSHRNIIFDNYIDIVYPNNIFGDILAGIYIDGGSKHNLIYQNNITNCKIGIDLAGASTNYLLYNHIHHHTNIGIRIGSSHNTIINNNIEYNNYGVRILSGTYQNNSFSKNEFNNIIKNAIDDGINNNWNNSIIGNFWHDYSGIDFNDDGIGDTPYNITNGIDVPVSQDYLPIWYTEPTITIISPTNNSYWNSAPIINVIAMDTTLNYTWYIVNNTLEFLQSEVDEYLRGEIWDSLLEGKFVIEFFANDSINNIGTSGVYIYKDTIAPTTTIDFTSHQEPNTVNTSTIFALTADDGIGSGIQLIRYKINESSWIPYSSPFGLSIYEPGYYIITYQAIDNAGNVETETQLLIKLVSIPSPTTDIPGYDVFILLGIVSIVSVFLFRRLYKK